MLTAPQRIKLRISLQQQGLTFNPLLDEMVDHVACDIEKQMEQGQSFEDALQRVIHHIPKDQLQTIQREAMETIRKRFILSRGLTFATAALFFISILFKLMHLQFTDELLLISFGCMATALLVSTFSGIYSNHDKKGALRILGVVSGIILSLVGYSFKMLHLPGADQLIVLGVIVTIASVAVNTFYVFRNETDGNLLTFLHEKNTPVIERFLLFLLIPLMLYKIITLNSGLLFVGNIVLIVVIFASGLQFIALSWRIMEKVVSKKSPLTTTMLMIAVTCLYLPFLGNLLALELRLVVISIFSVAAAALTYHLEQVKNKRYLWVVFLIPLISIGEALTGSKILPAATNQLVFNLPIMIILGASLFATEKHGPARMYVIISLASYLLQYR